MKSYLSLITVSARVRRRQSKMIIICIILAVFLVTSIVSLAEAGIHMETAHAVDKAGFWHIRINELEEETGRQIASRADVAAASWYSVVNLDENLKMDREYDIDGVRTALCGIQEPFITDIMHYFSEGSSVAEENEVILTENARGLLGVEAGDEVTLNTPAGSYDFVISGFRVSGDGKYVNSNGGIESALIVGENQLGVFMNMDTFHRICDANSEAAKPQLYVQFARRTNLKRALGEIKEQYHPADGDVDLNTILMAASGITDRSYIKNMFPLVVILFLLILVAGVMMISSSINSSVAQRQQFFGMLRCIGASKRQIISYVRLEALNWCKTAVPAGLLAGVMITWLLIAFLKYVIGGEYAEMSVFTVSILGIVCGTLIGVVTVLLAAQAPAKRAARVSPVAAVSGSGNETGNIKRAARMHLGRVEAALGIHHAVSAKKNLFLMTGSFALSIVLFLSFSVLTELIGCFMPQKASSPDMDIASPDASNSIDSALLEEIREIEGVSHAFGRRICFDYPVRLQTDSGAWDSAAGGEPAAVDLMSYDQYQLSLLLEDDDLRKGSDLTKVYGNGAGVLTIWDRDLPLEIGDVIGISGEELEIAGMLKYSPFSNDGSSGGKITIIASEENFLRLTGIRDYALIDVQMESRAGEKSSEAAEKIRALCSGLEVRDRRDETSAGEFYAVILFLYGFLAIIALIAVLNIMNSISMGVSARISQYGAMRAVGMSAAQVTGMIAVEAFTYALFGCIAGCGLGIPLSKVMYDFLITAHFYYFTWSLPVAQIGVILLFMLTAVAAAVWVPSKRIREMSVTDTIHAQ